MSPRCRRPLPLAAAWLVLVLAACGARADGGASDGSTTSGSADEGDGGAPRIECVELCARISNCHAQDMGRGEPCAWVLEGDTASCEARCDAFAADSLEGRCIDCMFDKLVCFGTAALRPCDAACEPTPFVTGYDEEQAPAYDFVEYFCGGG